MAIALLKYGWKDVRHPAQPSSGSQRALRNQVPPPSAFLLSEPGVFSRGGGLW